MRIGIVGCGNISGIYLENLLRTAGVEVVACADLEAERAREKATRYGIPVACDVEELLGSPDVDLVLNLTPPPGPRRRQSGGAGGGQTRLFGKAIGGGSGGRAPHPSLAKRRNLRVGCAPDTFFGAGLSTCRRLLREGAIGRPVAASAFMMSRGPERWHPDPGFFYEPGGGPMFDMGPYYLTALVVFLGPVRRVTGSASISFPEREVVGPGDKPRRFPVHVPTHVTGVLDFAGGAVGTIITSFDVWSSTPAPHRDLRGGGNPGGARSQSVRRRRPPPQKERPKLAGNSGGGSVPGERSGGRSGRHGPGDPGKPPPSGQRGARAPCARHHARIAPILPERHAPRDRFRVRFPVGKGEWAFAVSPEGAASGKGCVSARGKPLRPISAKRLCSPPCPEG